MGGPCSQPTGQRQVKHGEKGMGKGLQDGSRGREQPQQATERKGDFSVTCQGREDFLTQENRRPKEMTVTCKWSSWALEKIL